jgi:uncharacterized damage-inducible protein DinB
MTEQVSPLATFYKPGWEHYQQALVQTIASLSEDIEEPTVYQAASLVAMFEKSWHVISSALERWTCADLEQLFFPPASHQAWLRDQGLAEAPAHTRQWSVWHVMEHEIHHGGELSLALGNNGLNSFYTS